MERNRWSRNLHRQASIVFVVIVLFDAVFAALGTPPEWLFFLPLVPLAVLLVTGGHLFALPYRHRSRRATA